jgi:choline kinase
MRAIILAAGRGGRLARVTADLPKCLARVGRTTLIERQIQTLRECGITRISVITGHRSEHVRRVCGTGIDFVHNADYASTNSLYSLWLARRLLRGGFIVLNCDVLFHPQLLLDLLGVGSGDALLVAPRDAGTRYSEEEMKVRVRAGQVVDIAKTIPDGEADGENIGIAKFGPSGAPVLVQEMTRLVRAGATRAWLPAAFAAFGRRRPLQVVDSRGLPWIEIDVPEDYRRACLQVLPALDAGERQARQAGADETTSAVAAPERTRHV